MKIRVVDFFSGCGGTSCGFRAAGMEIAAGIDIDKDAAATYRKNFPEAEFFLKDVREMDENCLSAVVGARTSPILFAGCAPCQPFSKQNANSKRRDPRRFLLDEFSRFVKAWLPEHVFIENVPGMQNARGHGPFVSFTRLLKRLGYVCDFGVVPASWYGVPQTRERLVLVASRAGDIRIPIATHGKGRTPFSTVADWIAGLEKLSAGETSDADTDHVCAGLSDENLRRIRATPEGGGRDSWPRSLWLDCHKGHSGHTDVYGRLAWSSQASGLTTRCISYSNGRFGHPDQDRAISVREAACLQTFPREFQFTGSIASRARQIGNAVPPLMAEAFGQQFLALRR